MGLPGPGPGKAGGYSADSAVVIVAVQYAPAVPAEPTGVQVAGAERLAVPFLNCTVPLGPALELLADATIAVSVTLPPALTVVRLEVTETWVIAFVIVSVKVFEVACAL